MKDQKWKKMTLLDGTELEGKFKNGNLIEGIRIYPEGKYEGGEYENGKLIGGLTVLSDGVSLNGDYQNGQLIKGQRISNDETLIAVSYTHLTLPTIYSV